MYGGLGKGIPKDNYYLFKSCQAGSWYPGIETSLRFILDSIGSSYLDDPRQGSCVGCANHIGVIPLLPIVALNARNLTLASRSGKRNIVCNCPTCYSNLKDCKYILDGGSNIGKKALEAMDRAGMEFHDDVTISHVAEVYQTNLERLRAKARFSLHGLRAVTHHGCHYSNVYHRETELNERSRPTVLDKILEGFGAKVMDYPQRSLCCGLGFHHIMLYPDYTRAVAERKYSGIVEADPDLLVTMCAGCTLSLDMCQERLFSDMGVEKEIPVLDISELLALLLGADPYKVVGIDLHGVPIEPLMRKIGIPTVVR